MFVGEYRHNLDSKSRLSIPVKLREELGSEFYMCRGFDKCIMIYPESAWLEFADKLDKLQVVGDRHVSRYFFAGACPTAMDGQGRVVIPPSYREHAGIDKNVVLIGNNKRLELWDEATWDAELTTGLQSEDIMARLIELGF
ncbi:MAG: division/cell wall cluster transcriptional repressor MraZ [Clostridia bacterium]|nr:division/cell wall cluster transcriptional repressor MraZ [Clostridia bacterium]